MSNETVTLETSYAASSAEAESRARRWHECDPFPLIPAALLSSEHVKAYVKQTGMVFPFVDTRSRLKSASYEINPGGVFIYWDETEQKIRTPIRADTIVSLPPNSISFIQLECEFRLPAYIAIRFNLRITHVHRGLLLGTGPLVDPGFRGNILIPLHNLTSEEYAIRAGEGLIWVEFTKTSHRTSTVPVNISGPEPFVEIEARKNDQPPEYYLDKANKNRPIRSSIPVVVADARNLAERAARAARRARDNNRIFVGAGLIAIVAAIIGIFQLLEASKNNAIAVATFAGTTAVTASQAGADAKKALEEQKSFTSELKAENRQLAEQVGNLKQLLEDARARIEKLEKGKRGD